MIFSLLGEVNRLRNQLTQVETQQQGIAKNTERATREETEAQIETERLEKIRAELSEKLSARQMTLEMQHASGATVTVIANPVKLSATPPTYRTAPPALGEHNADVLTGLLGMSAAEIAELKAKGVV